MKTEVLDACARGRVLALDCATRTGWAVVEGGTVVASGMEDFRRRNGEHPGMIFQRFWEWLTVTVTEHVPTELAYEQAHHRGGAATRLCVGLTTRVEEMGSRWRLPVRSAHSQAIKKSFTGKGNAGKQAMYDKAWEVLGRVPVDDNEADAIALGLHVADGWGTEGDRGQSLGSPLGTERGPARERATLRDTVCL